MSNISSHVNPFTLTEDQLKFYDENGFFKSRESLERRGSKHT